MSNPTFLQSLMIQQAEAKSRYETLSEIIAQFQENESPTRPLTGLGALIKTRRIELGLSQEELGKQVGYTSGGGVSVLRVERETIRPRPERLKRFSEILGLDHEAMLALISAAEVSDFPTEQD